MLPRLKIKELSTGEKKHSHLLPLWSATEVLKHLIFKAYSTGAILQIGAPDFRRIREVCDKKMLSISQFKPRNLKLCAKWVSKIWKIKLIKKSSKKYVKSKQSSRMSITLHKITPHLPVIQMKSSSFLFVWEPRLKYHKCFQQRFQQSGCLKSSVSLQSSFDLKAVLFWRKITGLSR